MRDAPASERLGREVPDGLETLLAKCSSKSPDERPPTAAALARSLRALAREPALAWSDEQAREWWRANGPAQCET